MSDNRDSGIEDRINAIVNSNDQESQVPAENSIPDTWSLSERNKEAIRLANRIHKTKHGLFASVPLLCKAEDCPYAETCEIQVQGMAPQYERCPAEIASIMDKFQRYCDTFNIDPDSADYVQMSLIKRAIDAEIMIERAEKLIAGEGEIIKDVVVGMTEDGTAVRKPEISQAVTIKQREEKRLNEALQLLNSTPKDKAKDVKVDMDVSQYAAQLREKLVDLRQKDEESIDVDYEEIDEPGEESRGGR